jgi:hypothetical protein
MAGKLPSTEASKHATAMVRRIVTLLAQTDEVRSPATLYAAFAALVGQLPLRDAKQYASDIGRGLVRSLHSAEGDSGLAEVVGLLDADRLVQLLKQPGATEKGREILLAQLGKEYKHTFRNVWELVEYVERNDLRQTLAAPLRRTRQIPRPTSASVIIYAQ